jgi:hypothetical protein
MLPMPVEYEGRDPVAIFWGNLFGADRRFDLGPTRLTASRRWHPYGIGLIVARQLAAINGKRPHVPWVAGTTRQVRIQILTTKSFPALVMHSSSIVIVFPVVYVLTPLAFFCSLFFHPAPTVFAALLPPAAL